MKSLSYLLTVKQLTADIFKFCWYS